ALAPSGGVGRGEKREPKKELRFRPVYAGALAGIVAVALGPATVALESASLRSAVVEAARDRGWEDVVREARTGVEAHPSEPVFPLMLGYALVAEDDPNALRWLNRAMALAPGWWEPHQLTARWLVRHGAVEQAWLEVREARRLAPEQLDPCIP